MDANSKGRIGDNVKRLCGMHDVSQAILAEHVEMSKQGLNNIVVGRSQPSFATARKLAAAFGISVDDLVEDTFTCMQAGAAAMEAAPILLDHPDRVAAEVAMISGSVKAPGQSTPK